MSAVSGKDLVASVEGEANSYCRTPASSGTQVTQWSVAEEAACSGYPFGQHALAMCTTSWVPRRTPYGDVSGCSDGVREWVRSLVTWHWQSYETAVLCCSRV